MRTLLIITILLFYTHTSYSAMPKRCDTTKAKLKQPERTKKQKKQGGEEPDVRIQPNFMTLIY
jgi:hypothetical protein